MSIAQEFSPFISARQFFVASRCRGLTLMVLVIVAAGIAPALPSAAADAPAVPRYQFKAGEHYIYEINIEATLPDGKETLSGQSEYTVKSVDATTGQMTLVNRATLATRKEAKPVARPMGPPMRRPGPFGGPFSGPSYGTPREVVIDPQGTAIKYNGDCQLPFLLGNLWQLLIDPLPAEGKQTWDLKRDIAITEAEDRFRWIGPMMSRDSSGARRPGHETTTYTLGPVAAGIVTIQKKYELATAEKAGDAPAMEHVGTGQIKFDLKAGVPASVEMNLTIRINTENATVRIPTVVKARLLDAAEAAKIIRDQAAAQEKVRATIAENAKPKPIDDAAIDQALTDLKAKDVFKVRAAADQLAKAIPIEARRAQVAAALEPLLTDRDHWIPISAAKGLGAWGSKANVPALIAALNERDVFLRAAAMAALGNLKDPRAAEAIAKTFLDFASRRDAGNALRAMGAMAEPVVIPLLNDRDWGVQLEACKVLGDIGTAASLKPLQSLPPNTNRLVTTEAEKAIAAIQLRLPV